MNHPVIVSLRKLERLHQEIEPDIDFAWNPPPPQDKLKLLDGLPGLPEGLREYFQLHDGQRLEEGWGTIIGGFYFPPIDKMLECYEHQSHTADAYGSVMSDAHARPARNQNDDG